MTTSEIKRRYLYRSGENIVWHLDCSDNVYETVRLARDYLTLDINGNIVTLWWLSLKDNHRAYRIAPVHLVEATKAWINHYRGIEFANFMNKMFGE